MQANLTPYFGFLMFGALLVALAILVAAHPIGVWLDILDHPDGVRKKHPVATPLVGGLAIMVPFTLWAFAMLLWNPATLDTRLLLAVLLGGGGATLVGYADDQTSTSPSSRFLSLILLSVIALVIDPALVPLQINWGSFTPFSFTVWGAFVFVAVAMTGFVNSVNMADGQNGLVLGMYVIWSVCLLFVTHGTGMNIAQILLETTLIVLMFNLAGKVFLGDSGTYGITFIFGLLTIIAHNRWGVTAETIIVWFFIPIVDCLRLMISRTIGGSAPIKADHDHLHHRLQDKLGYVVGLFVYLSMIAVTSLIASILPHLALVCMIVLAAFYFSFAWLAETEVQTVLSLNDDTRRPANVVKLESKDTASDRK